MSLTLLHSEEKISMGNLVKKVLPVVLLGVGIGCSVAATIVTANKKKKPTEIPLAKEQTKAQKFVATIKDNKEAIVLQSVSVLSLVAYSIVLKKRIAFLESALATTAGIFALYREQIKEKLSVDEELTLYNNSVEMYSDAIADDRISHDNAPSLLGLVRTSTITLDWNQESCSNVLTSREYFERVKHTALQTAAAYMDIRGWFSLSEFVGLLGYSQEMKFCVYGFKKGAVEPNCILGDDNKIRIRVIEFGEYVTTSYPTTELQVKVEECVQ